MQVCDVNSQYTYRSQINTRLAQGNLGRAPIASDTSAKCLANPYLDTSREKELTTITISLPNEAAHYNP